MSHLKSSKLVSCAALFALGFNVAWAQETTGTTGGNVPFQNMQPSLVVTQAVPLVGIYPSSSGSASGATLGFVYNFGGVFSSPSYSLPAQGQLLPISENTALFSLLGTTYGGDGRTTFGLPNLTGTAAIGTGMGPGLTNRILGAATGSPTVSLSTAQLPAHNHTLAGAVGGATDATGSNHAFSNMQPSLPLNRVIAVSGTFPSRTSGAGSAFLGQVATFAGSSIPGGWMRAEGQLLSITSNSALFSLLGTTYGGDGRTTFALPDLRGRVSVGAGTGLGLPSYSLGQTFGQESTVLTEAQMPAHDHTALGGTTGMTGGGAPVDNVQPSLALNYLIALNGIYPSISGGFDDGDPLLGQIVEFAGNFAPAGWAFAHGQLLPISSNVALFSILGTRYGGDGRTTFALPDLRGRTLIGSGGIYDVGEQFGTAFNTLTVANLAAHSHTFAIPEPEIYAMLGVGLGLMGWAASRKKLKEAA